VEKEKNLCGNFFSPFSSTEAVEKFLISNTPIVEKKSLPL